MKNFRADVILAAVFVAIICAGAVLAAGDGEGIIYFPIARVDPTLTPTPTPTPTPSPTPTPTATPTPPPSTNVEFRGLWVTRFNWTSLNHADEQPSDIDRIVDDAAYAGFNAILFQVRGEADAFYKPGLEPWSARLVGLGQDPGWDPLARMIERAHSHGMQVHAYFNVYPVWTCGDPPPVTNPLHLYHHLNNAHGVTGGKSNGLQWTESNEVHCSGYRRATPASVFLDDHMMAVATDIVQRYDIDGLHLDHIRYGGSGVSCDPVSEERSGVRCFTAAPSGYASYQAWQRAQVNGTVSKFYHTLFGEDGQGGGVADKPNFMLSAAVWPYYESGRNSYYQDSRAWPAGGYIDALMPMLYGSFDTSPEIWRDYAAGFQNASAGRHIIPGIHGAEFGGQFGTFDDIAQRIEAARQLGTAGHAIFAYNFLESNGYFDDLRFGPYAEPADPPPIPWHP